MVTIDPLDTPGGPQFVAISQLKPFIPHPARDALSLNRMSKGSLLSNSEGTEWNAIDTTLLNER
uniref:Uncharacterized protein n=1 Tax=Romanomermis culicivorax TaxID=13658 RepID=A0A915HNK0_ROMCU